MHVATSPSPSQPGVEQALYRRQSAARGPIRRISGHAEVATCSHAHLHAQRFWNGASHKLPQSPCLVSICSPPQRPDRARTRSLDEKLVLCHPRPTCTPARRARVPSTPISRLGSGQRVRTARWCCSVFPRHAGEPHRGKMVRVGGRTGWLRI